MATKLTTTASTILIVFVVVVVYSPQSINCLKTTLFDTTKIREDLNWQKLSFREINSNNQQQQQQQGENLLGWKESSFALENGGDDIWRIHFVCDLNVQNIQNWLFTPLIETRDANRVALNLTFTIRECEQFPIKQVVKNCREKFELYYEEIDASSSIEQQQQINSSTSEYFMSKIKQLRFRDTFVSSADSGASPNKVSSSGSSGLRYYNSVVDRQRHSKTGSSYINVELREIPLSNNGGSHIRFAIRDTGACISLLSVQVSYTSCPAVVKHGIKFDETPTGRDLTDLVQVSGRCPAFSAEPVSGQAPKAICTAKGEWLITDLNLANRCLCLPGYQFFADRCTPCTMGSYKLSTSNDERCLACPENSWSSISGATSCQCMGGYYRENESDLSSSCIAIRRIDSSSLQVALVAEERVNISIPTLTTSTSNVQIDLRCFTCSPHNYGFYYRDECDKSCFVASSGPNWLTIVNKTGARSRLKIEIKQLLNSKELSRSVVYVGLNEKPLIDGDVICEPKETEPKSLLTKSLKLPKVIHHRSKPTTCLNLSINLNQQLNSIFLQHDLIEKVRSNRLAKFDIYTLMVSNDYHLIPVGNNEPPTTKSYQRLETADYSLDLLKSVILNSTASYSFLLCNNIDEIEKVRIELGFRRNAVDLGEDVVVVAEENDRFDVYSIEGKLFDMCVKNPLNSKFVRQFGDLHLFDYSNSNHSASLMASLKNSLSERSLNPNGSSSSDVASSNFKIHFLLPITLSFLLVTAIILLALFVRRYRANSKSADKDYDCEKHMRKFMPALSKSCSSTKCITCSSQNTSSNSSTSSRISSNSPSTTCTSSTSSSQILNNQHHHSIANHQRNSKLYYVDPHTYEDPALAIQEFAQEISPLDIKIESVIGGGEFGDVCKGKLKNGAAWTTVAIKTLKVGSSEKNRCDFLTEASIMAQFHHENIICLEGVVTQSNPLMIITEYMDNGSLDTFLRLNSWRLNIYDLIKMLRDIASGMKYLSEMNFVHRDLAARNILVNKDLKCKVADFGLSREIEGTTTEGVYWTKGGKIPVRWTAPEAISHTKFTCSSDVWSFGVVAWEVMSYGERPYWNWSNTDVIKAVEKGFRLLIPSNCPQIIYNLMLDCWDGDRLKRPRFRQIVNDLDTIIKSKRECLYATVKSAKQTGTIDPNRPNFTQMTNVQEWLNSLGLGEYIGRFVAKRFLNLSQVLNLELSDLVKLEVYDESHQSLIIESIKRIQFELNFQNGFLV